MRFPILISRRTRRPVATRVASGNKSLSGPWRVPLSALLAVILILPGGCGLGGGTVKGVLERDAPSVRAGQKAVVLVRLAPRLDNAFVPPVDRFLGEDFPILLQWSDINRRESPHPVSKYWSWAFSPSTMAAAGNWVYYLLPPGEYWLTVRGHAEFTKMEDAYVPRNNFYLEVPEDVPLLYAGTLSGECTSSWSFLGRVAARCGPLSIEDESEACEVVARRDLAEFGPMKTILMRPAAWEPRAGNAGDLEPMGVILNGSPPLLTPDWKLRGVGRATGLGSETVMGLLGGTPSPPSPLATLEQKLYLGYFAYLPLGAAAGLIGGRQSEQEWGPCMHRIAADVTSWSPPDALGTALVEALAVRGVKDVTVVDDASLVLREDGQPRFRTLLEVDIQDVVFRECGTRWTFCSEMKVRGRLRELATGRVLYHGILVHSNHSRRFPLSAPMLYTRPYERFAGSNALCRKIEDYCGRDGAAFFIEDLGVATRRLAQRLIVEVGVPLGDAGSSGAPGPPDPGGHGAGSND